MASFSKASEQMEFPLSQRWCESFYPELEAKLHYSHQRDARARDELALLLRAKKVASFDWGDLERRIRNSTTFVFGAGPSLDDDIKCLYPIIRKSSFPIIAADGAMDALAETMILPRVAVSDLDSASEEMLVSQSNQRALFIHAHGDNLDLLSRLVPRFGDKIFGSTQVESVELVQNIGGLTDGDRACYLVSAFCPKIIVLAGMDFGVREGEYSKARTESNKASQDERKTKMELGRRSLEFLISNSPEIKFINATARGEAISGAVKMNCEESIKEFS